MQYQCFLLQHGAKAKHLGEFQDLETAQNEAKSEFYLVVSQALVDAQDKIAPLYGLERYSVSRMYPIAKQTSIHWIAKEDGKTWIGEAYTTGTMSAPPVSVLEIVLVNENA